MSKMGAYFVACTSISAIILKFELNCPVKLLNRMYTIIVIINTHDNFSIIFMITHP